MSQDMIQYEILEDGTISVITDQVSGVNHRSADELLKQLAETAGGSSTIKQRSKFAHVHNHADGSTHIHTH